MISVQDFEQILKEENIVLSKEELDVLHRVSDTFGDFANKKWKEKKVQRIIDKKHE